METNFNLIVIFALTLSAFSFITKSILKSNGYQVNWFVSALRDNIVLWRLIGKVENSSKRIAYITLATVYPLLIITFIVYGILHIKGF